MNMQVEVWNAIEEPVDLILLLASLSQQRCQVQRCRLGPISSSRLPTLGSTWIRKSDSN